MKLNRIKIFMVFIFIFLLAGCGIKGDPQEVLNQYYQGIKDSNIENTYSTLCKESSNNFSKEDFIKWQDTNKEITSLKEVKLDKINEYKDKEIDGIKFKNVTEFSVTEIIEDFYNDKQDRRNYTRYVVNDDGEWKVYRGKENGKELVSDSLSSLAWMYIEGKGNKEKDLNKAAMILNESLKYNKDSIIAKYALASTYVKLERYDEAIKSANEYIQKSKENIEKSDGYNVLGIAYEGENQIDKAKECFNKAIKLDANNQYAKTNLERVKKY